MDFTAVIIASLTVGAIGLVVGILLSILGKVLAVVSDERVEAVRNELPGNNCGGCGLAGCDACAKAIVDGEVAVDVCPVGGAELAAKIADIMGVTVEAGSRKAAFVHCSGNCAQAPLAALYTGAADCHAAELLGGSGRSCEFGCYGLGSCVAACPFDAITIEDRLAKVDRDACKACGKCVSACPQHIITLEPYDAVAEIACSSHSKGKMVMNVCKSGCIGCGLCSRNCPTNSITIVDNLPVIDQSTCIRCSVCVDKCPRKIIRFDFPVS
ncbi:MAG: RnfABCDGE type electron transport complex subunit B [Clostridia bacterium]|nr:RnfABCDGE type electron transport complex subunit B [Clostridia bacterium]